MNSADQEPNALTQASRAARSMAQSCETLLWSIRSALKALPTHPQLTDSAHLRIETLPETKLVGVRLAMCFAEDRTRELWQQFMPRRDEIPNRVGRDLYSLSDYGDLAFSDLTPGTMFEKWAAVEVSSTDDIPAGFELHRIPTGLYSVFMHRGPASAFQRTGSYIFDDWLPASGYELDRRDHFEVLGPGYRPDDPHAEEEVWIPIRLTSPATSPRET